MEAPGYGEEEEPLNTILGKVWSVSICWNIIIKDSYGYIMIMEKSCF